MTKTTTATDETPETPKRLKPKTVPEMNFPIQANGAEMMRLGLEQIDLWVPLHDLRRALRRKYPGSGRAGTKSSKSSNQRSV
mgnify:CR=1 FL=1